MLNELSPKAQSCEHPVGTSALHSGPKGVPKGAAALPARSQSGAAKLLSPEGSMLGAPKDCWPQCATQFSHPLPADFCAQSVTTFTADHCSPKPDNSSASIQAL